MPIKRTKPDWQQNPPNFVLKGKAEDDSHDEVLTFSPSEWNLSMIKRHYTEIGKKFEKRNGEKLIND